MNPEIVSQAAKAAPPVVVSTAAFLGDFSLNNAIGVLTMLYLVLQVGYLLWKWRTEREDRKVARKARLKP